MDGGSTTPFREVFRSLRGAFVGIAALSCLINILQLTGPIFMLQVYDRVLTSRSVPTLLVIGCLAIALYLFYGVLEGLRGRVVSRVGQRVDAQLSGAVYVLSTALPLKLGPRAAKVRPVQDLDAIRQFLSGPGPSTICDLPWMPFYLGIVYLFHPYLGYAALTGALVICVLIALNEAFSRQPSTEAAEVANRRFSVSEESRRNAESVQAMGMSEALTGRWLAENDVYLEKQRHAADWSGFFGTAIKTFRLTLQSLMLGLGAWLAIEGEVTAGVMIAASIMTSRALAPVEQAVGHWRSFLAARQSLRHLKLLMATFASEGDRLNLPLPRETVKVDKLSCGPIGGKEPFVHDVSFDLAAGDGLGILGPSGSGKSTLVRALLGLTPTMSGSVRFDGAELTQWPPESRGKFIGYLPQDVQLFDGTVAENIARFSPDVPADAVIEAAKLAKVHDAIVKMPDGYNTVVGPAGFVLSGGYRQRIALARVLFGNPFLLVLDEPNSNLDAVGDAALTEALNAMRARGSIVVIVAHRSSAIAAVNKILVLEQGRVATFGPKEEVMRRIVRPSTKGAAA